MERSSIDEYETNLKFFEKKGYRVIPLYCKDKEEGLSLSSIDTDIIFVQQPSVFIKNQRLYNILFNGLVCYIPYGLMVANNNDNHYNTIFNDILWKYFAPNEIIKDLYLSANPRVKSDNIFVSGHPKMDRFSSIDNENNSLNQKKKIIIYAPHHAFEEKSLKYGTFPWNGREILEYAKRNHQYHFVFKPHPRLKHALVANGLMTNFEAQNYYEAWSNLPNGEVNNTGDYFDLFNSSSLLITDCGSFLAEYFLTDKPVILLKNKESQGYNRFGEKIVESYYLAYEFLDVTKLIEQLLINGYDPKLVERTEENYKLIQPSKNTAKSIIEHLIKYKKEKEKGK
ncbi:CDP-glycerol glycerophosphotransferase family protein [Vibrio breoganii]